jgi:hypothetical protein
MGDLLRSSLSARLVCGQQIPPTGDRFREMTAQIVIDQWIPIHLLFVRHILHTRYHFLFGLLPLLLQVKCFEWCSCLSLLMIALRTCIFVGHGLTAFPQADSSRNGECTSRGYQTFMLNRRTEFPKHGKCLECHVRRPRLRLFWCRPLIMTFRGDERSPHHQIIVSQGSHAA